MSVLDSYAKTFLYVPPFFLAKGVYRFTFSITIRSPDNSHPLLPFYAAADTHVNVVPSPIIGQLTDGAQSRVVRGWGQKVKFAPGNYSIDPDDAENKDFKITWFCRRLPSEVIERDLSDAEQPLTKPLYNRPAGQLPSEEDDDQGGCFGRGPGKIDIIGGEVEWRTDYFYMPSVTYEIVVRIDPPDRASSWTGIQLVLLERTPPSIKVKCQTPALCYPHVPIGQKINPVRVGLVGLCNEDCDGQLSFEWSIYGVDKKGNENHLPEAAEFVVGATDEKMALGKEFFDQYYPKFGDFIAKLSVTNEEGDRGESDIFLHVRYYIFDTIARTNLIPKLANN